MKIFVILTYGPQHPCFCVHLYTCNLGKVFFIDLLFSDMTFDGNGKVNYGGKDLIKFACWNIRGYNSKIIGKKFLSEDFLKEIRGSDIIGLIETHIHNSVLDDLAIPGYTLISYLNGKCNPKSHTAPGGLALFCKESFSKYIVPVSSDNEDVIWIKIKKETIIF